MQVSSMMANIKAVPRVVLDTNILVAAGFRPQSGSGRILERIRDGRVRLVWDQATRAETRYILEKIPPLDWRTIETLFRAEDEYMGPAAPERFAAIPDPDDRKFAALAYAARAILVTNDRHLLDFATDPPLQVMTPAEFQAAHEA